MKLFICIISLLVPISLLVVAISSEPVLSGQAVVEQRPTDSDATFAGPPKLQLSSIFNFHTYKKMFRRVYGGIEETVRRKLMLARAFRAWISSLKYRYHKISYYLSLNQFSDRSEGELRRMENQHLQDETDDDENAYDYDYESASIPDASLEALTGGRKGDMRETLQASSDGRQTTSRRKREAVEGPRRDSTRKGVRDKRHKMDWHEPLPDEQYHRRTYSFFANKSRLRVRPWLEGSGVPRLELPDEVYYDHRDSGCMFEARDQDDCGCCYAFTGIAIAEWLHCQLTGQRMAFSEQYLVDCGKATNLTGGCHGSTFRRTANFIHNYGLELRANYPYTGREGQCPYDENTRRQSMGHIRMDLGSGLKVPLDSFEDYLPFGPMYIAINTKNGFHEYGGGVMEAEGCEPQGRHAVVLVGHGRQHGREYWLIRNSHSVGWGEQGHYKLAKHVDCIPKRFGWLYGTDDGLGWLIEPDKNSLYNPKVLKSHYRKRVRTDVNRGLL